MATMGLPVEIDPLRGLLLEVWRTAGHIAWLESEVRRLNPEALVWGMTKEKRLVGDPDGPGAVIEREFMAQPNVWYKLYVEERKHFVEVCRVAIQCGLAERQVQIAEEQGRLIGEVLLATLADLGIDRNEMDVRLALRRRLLLAAGEEPGEEPAP